MTDDDGADGRREVLLSRRRDTIQRWADDHGQVPVREAGDAESGRFRLVRESGVGHSGERLAWDQFFEAVEAGDHVVIDHGEASGDPLEVASYDDVLERVADDRERVRSQLDDGQTVTVPLGTPTASEETRESTHTTETESPGSDPRRPDAGAGTTEGAGGTEGTGATGGARDTEGAGPTGAERGVDDLAERVLLTDDEVGKTVLDATGEEVGVVTAVAEGEKTMFVDVDPGITTRVRTALGWERTDDEDLRVGADRVESVAEDAVRLRDVEEPTD